MAKEIYKAVKILMAESKRIDDLERKIVILNSKVLRYEKKLERLSPNKKLPFKKNSVFKIKISDMKLTKRTYKSLAYQRLETIADLSKYSWDEILRFRNFGEASKNELEKKLVALGVKLDYI